MCPDTPKTPVPSMLCVIHHTSAQFQEAAVNHVHKMRIPMPNAEHVSSSPLAVTSEHLHDGSGASVCITL